MISAFEMSENVDIVESATETFEISLLCPFRSGKLSFSDGLRLASFSLFPGDGDSALN
jgi:hypothetical protein